MNAVLANEKNSSVSCVGSALEADKKINLGCGILVIVHAEKAAWSSTQRRSSDVRGDGLYPASRLPLAGSAGHFRALEFRVYPLATLVSGRIVGTVAGGAGAAGPRHAAVSGCQPCEGASGCEQSRRWPAKSGHWVHQGRSEYQNQCVGGRRRTSRELEFGSGTARRCECRASDDAPKAARHDHRGRQGLRQRQVSGAVAALGEPCLHPAAKQPTQTCKLASWLLSKAAQGGEFVPAVEALSPNRDALWKKRPVFFGLRPIGRCPGLAQKLILKTRPNSYSQ